MKSQLNVIDSGKSAIRYSRGLNRLKTGIIALKGLERGKIKTFAATFQSQTMIYSIIRSKTSIFVSKMLTWISKCMKQIVFR